MCVICYAIASVHVFTTEWFVEMLGFELELFVMGLASILDFITIKSVLGRKSMRLY